MENRQSTNNNLGNGFLFGVIVGAIVTLLFTTKKGRQILNRLTEEGKDQVAVLQGRLEEVKHQVTDEIEEFGEHVFVEEEEKTSKEKIDSDTIEEEKSAPKKVIKKFFKKG